MNSLEQYIEYEKLDPVKAMNALQDHGIISDNCIEAKDVIDAGVAVTWLDQNFWKI
jgi:hypothetical protein